MTPESHTLNDGQELAGVSGYISEAHQNIPAKPLTFSTIVADPPWDYPNRMRGNMTKGEMRSEAFDEYPTMSVWEIAALPVRRWASENAHLYLWTTQTFLREAYTVLDAWGFKQGAVLVWSKPPKGVCGSYVCSVEFCLFARRGNLAHKKRQLGTCYSWPRSGHSAKPEAFIDMVEAVSPGPYLEMFARRNRLGWSTFGNECLQHIGAVAPAPQKYNKQI